MVGGGSHTQVLTMYIHLTDPCMSWKGREGGRELFPRILLGRVFPEHLLQVSPAIPTTCTWLTSTSVFPIKAYHQRFQPVKANAFGASLLGCSLGSSKVMCSKLKSSLPFEMFTLLPCSLPEQTATLATGSPSQNPEARGFYLSCVSFIWRP